MSKAGEKLIRAAKQARSIARGEADPESYEVHVPEQVDVRAIRSALGMTQQTFSAAFGINLSTLRKWEQDGRTPEGPARAYLKVIEKDPQAVIAALGSPSQRRARSSSGRRASKKRAPTRPVEKARA